jgi:16S rRNA (cytosine967-C5)-methyltransferase
MKKISPARLAAYRILLEVEEGRAHADTMLRANFVSQLSAPDRHLATALVLGVLRWQLRLDHEFRKFLTKPNAKLDRAVLLSLRIGALQIVQMERIPARAAIDESVELTQKAGHHFAARMVNAVLRKLAAAGVSFSCDAASDAQTLALAYAHPEWMVTRWIARYGLEASKKICAHGQQQPELHLRISEAAVEAELTAAGVQFAPGHLLTAARVFVAGDTTATLHDDRARVQDEGSQLIAELTAASAPSAEKILDTCAAPGGKTLVLAERFPAAQIVACEISEARCAELRTRLVPIGSRVDVRCADAALPFAEKDFDLILVDAPCSGTGTLGRNPEIRHRLKPEEFARQAERQRAILSAAFAALRPGGRLVYSTCSLEPEENEAVVASVLASTTNARQISCAAVLDALAQQGRITPEAQVSLRTALTPEGALQLLPGTHPSDGFFAALIEKAI